jgi:hypothetical protein
MSGCIKVSNQSKYAKLIDVVLHVTVWAAICLQTSGGTRSKHREDKHRNMLAVIISNFQELL